MQFNIGDKVCANRKHPYYGKLHKQYLRKEYYIITDKTECNNCTYSDCGYGLILDDRSLGYCHHTGVGSGEFLIAKYDDGFEEHKKRLSCL